MTSASSLRSTGFCKWLNSHFFPNCFLKKKKLETGQIEGKMCHSLPEFQAVVSLNQSVCSEPRTFHAQLFELHSLLFRNPSLSFSHPSLSIYGLVSSLALCLFPGIDYVPPLMSWATPSVPVSWNTCPVMSCRERTLSSATRWWRRKPTRSRTSSSARRTSTRTRGVQIARLRCRGCR